jgi:hypothetical protein
MSTVVFFAVLSALASDSPMATPALVKPVDTAELLEKYDMGFHLNQDISVLATVTTVDRDKQQPALVEKTAAGIVRLGLDRNEYGKLALILPGDTLVVSGKIASFDRDTKIVRLALCWVIERRKKE